jgi:predicted DNA binding CopG/RHH family protein
MPKKPCFPQASEIRRHFRPATPWAERDLLPKGDRVNVRVSSTEKVEMAQTAEAFGLGVSEYLLRLHRLTVAIGHGGRIGRRRP